MGAIRQISGSGSGLIRKSGFESRIRFWPAAQLALSECSCYYYNFFWPSVDILLLLLLLLLLHNFAVTVFLTADFRTRPTYPSQAISAVSTKPSSRWTRSDGGLGIAGTVAAGPGAAVSTTVASNVVFSDVTLASSSRSSSTRPAILDCHAHRSSLNHRHLVPNGSVTAAGISLTRGLLPFGESHKTTNGRSY